MEDVEVQVEADTDVDVNVEDEVGDVEGCISVLIFCLLRGESFGDKLILVLLLFGSNRVGAGEVVTEEVESNKVM